MSGNLNQTPSNYKLDRPKVYCWKEHQVDQNLIDTDNIIEIAQWAKSFSGVHRLDNDVSRALERCVVGSYQAGYLLDNFKIQDLNQRKQYLTENISSILLHLIASFEMIDREYYKILEPYYKWNLLCTGFEIIKDKGNEIVGINPIETLFEYILKYQRWMLYYHMKRTKRWNEDEFKNTLRIITFCCCKICQEHDLDLALGFALTLSKLQDQEIKRH